MSGSKYKLSAKINAFVVPFWGNLKKDFLYKLGINSLLKQAIVFKTFGFDFVCENSKLGISVFESQLRCDITSFYFISLINFLIQAKLFLFIILVLSTNQVYWIVNYWHLNARQILWLSISNRLVSCPVHQMKCDKIHMFATLQK